MSNAVGIDTSIGWAQWQLRGGWRNTLLTTGAYATAIIVFIIITLRLSPNNRTDVLWGWRAGLLGLQAALLVVFAGSRVVAAVRGDINSRMIESHRLMPVPPLTAVSGYIWGPTAQSMMIALANLLIGAGVAAGAGIDLRVWFGANAILFTFAVFCWIVCAYAASVIKAAGAVLLGILIALPMSQGIVILIFPGLLLMITPLAGRSIFWTSIATGELNWAQLASIVLQVIVAATLYVGAARKYRRSEDSALGVLPAMVLLAAWVGASAIGILHWDELHWSWFGRLRFDERTAFITSALSAMLLATAPIANAARDPRITAWSPLIALGCALIVFTIICAAPGSVWDELLVAMLVIPAAFAVGICFVLRIVYRVTRRGWVIGLMWIVLSWLVPLIIEYSRWAISEAEVEFELTPVAACSPVGALILIGSRSDASPNLGLGFQVCIALTLACLYYATRPIERAAEVNSGTADQARQSHAEHEL